MFNSMSGLYFMSSYELIVKRSLDSKKKVLIDFKLEHLRLITDRKQLLFLEVHSKHGSNITGSNSTEGYAILIKFTPCV